MHQKKLLSLIALLISWLAIVSPAVAALTVDEVASRLSCYCGTCPHLVVTDCGCSTADQIKADIKQKIDAGMTSDQIVQAYVAQYGQTVLSAPPKQGFNLTAWFVPFIGFVVGGAVLVVFLKRQQNNPTADDSADADTSTEEHDEYRRRLQQELDLRK